MIYTFWEGAMPAYIKLCIGTWKFPFTILNYANLHEYTDYDFEKAKRFTLPEQADCVRVHVLRDNGGVWLDADTISITGTLPKENMIGDPEIRSNTIGYLRTERGSEMFKKWAAYQDGVIALDTTPTNWDVMGNAFTDPYLKEHADISIADVKDRWPETYMISGRIQRYSKYTKFYFDDKFNLSDINKTDILMLHNSWTPGWYKELSRNEVLERDCTLSNILRELL